MDQEQLSQENAESMKTAFASGGLSKLREYLNTKRNEWKLIPLNIAVTGNSGVGKSCFINAFRNVKRGEELFAEENVVEQTAEPTPYMHPEHHNFILWDLPGVGTPKFPRDKYLKKVDFEKYDFFLILSCSRFTDNDFWLADTIRRSGKRFFFVRTQVDFDILKRNDLKEEDVLHKVRENCINMLNAGRFDHVEELLFLINNKDQRAYDFDSLTSELIKKIPTEKREALVLSITFLTDGVIKEKQKALQKHIYLVAIASAVSAAVPIPGVGAAVDASILLAEAMHYRKQFGLDDETMEQNANVLGTTANSLKKHLNLKSFIISASAKTILAVCSSVAWSEMAENVTKFALPIIGSIIAASVSYGICVAALRNLLQSFTDDALIINKEMARVLSTRASSSLE